VKTESYRVGVDSGSDIALVFAHVPDFSIHQI